MEEEEWEEPNTASPTVEAEPAEIHMEDEEKEEQQKDTHPSGEMYTLRWWRRSTSRDTAVCGYVFNDPDGECPDGSYHRIHLDQTLDLDNLQEGSVVSTIASEEGSVPIRLGVRKKPILSTETCEQEEDEVKRLEMYCNKYTATVTKLA